MGVSASKARAIEGTQILHSFTPISTTKLMVKAYSKSDSEREVKVSTSTAALTLSFEENRGFVTVKYDDKLYLAYVIQISKSSALNLEAPVMMTYSTGKL